MPKDEKKERFENSQGTGNLDEGFNETIMLPWTDSVSTKPTEYTQEKKKKEKMTRAEDQSLY